MTVTEEAQHRLHTHLEEIMGEQHAAALMEWIPDGPLASKADIEELRTELKQDIDHLREVMDLRFVAVHQRFEMVDQRFETMATKEMVLDLKAELHREMRTQTYVILGAISAMTGIATAIARMA